MSIDEVMLIAARYAVLTRTATISDAREMALELRAAIEQHVAEAVKAETERCIAACDSARLSQNSRFGFDGLFVEVANTAIDACMEAIRARADNEEAT